MEAASIEVWEALIDDAKVAYIVGKDVTPEDIDEVHGYQPRYFIWNSTWALYDMIGPNRTGRFLVVGLQQVTDRQYRLVTAYWNGDGRAERIYKG